MSVDNCGFAIVAGANNTIDIDELKVRRTDRVVVNRGSDIRIKRADIKMTSSTTENATSEKKKRRKRRSSS